MSLQEFHRSFASPIGWVTMRATDRGIVGIEFGDAEVPSMSDVPAFLLACQAQIGEYFAGKRREFVDLPLALRGTDFQVQVWQGASDIPFGFTRTYAELAEDIGSPSAARAVGSALGRNPLAIIVPCHRIVAASGEDSGFAWGMERKRWLLEHERK